MFMPAATSSASMRAALAADQIADAHEEGGEPREQHGCAQVVHRSPPERRAIPAPFGKTEWEWKVPIRKRLRRGAARL